MAALSLVVVCAIATACPMEPEWCEGDATALDAHAYRLVDESEDPYASADETVRCQAEADVRVEELGLEPSVTVETTFCNHATVTQPLPVVAHAGTRVHTRIWYYSQTTFSSATARVRLALGDEELVAKDVSIPSESALISEDAVVDEELPVGTPVFFHVGNHGDNSWNLLEVSLFPRAPCE